MSAPTPPAAELAVLRALWDDAPRSARELAAALYGDESPGSTATVLTLLGRLEQRGLVSRDRSRRAHRFAPAVSRAAYAADEVEGLAERLSGGSLAPLVSHLIGAGRLSAADLAELRRALADHDAKRWGDGE